MRNLWLFLALLLIAPLAPVQAQSASTERTRVALACCVDLDSRQQAWEAVQRFNPGLVLFLGDMIDVQADEPDDMLKAYEIQKRSRGLRLVRQNAMSMAIWNNHDYTIGDQSHRNHGTKAEIRQLFIEQWNEPYNSERYYRQDGLYGSMMLGEAPQRVQILLLDTRWHREPLTSVSWWQKQINYWWHQRGPWLAQSEAPLLGEVQWRWLAEQLQQPAELRIIANAMPVLAGDTGFENWALFPAELVRLQEVLQKTQANGVVLAGAGPHWGDLSTASEFTDYPLWQVTPGSINQTASFIPANPYRIGVASSDARFGTIEVFWRDQDPLVTLATRDLDGRIISSQELRLSELGEAAGSAIEAEPAN